MITRLDSFISIETLFWLFPLIFLLHDFEEIIFVEMWFRKNYTKSLQRVPKRMKKIFMSLSTISAAEFSIPVFLQLLFYMVATYLAAEKQVYAPFIGFNSFLFLHVFIHIVQSVFIRNYALGVGSAVVTILPYSLYLFYRLVNEQMIRVVDLVIYLPFGLVTVLVVLFGHWIAPKILQSNT